MTMGIDETMVVAVLEGRRKEDVKAFLDSIPEPLKNTVKQVCTDMCDACLYAAMEVFGKQKIVVLSRGLIIK